MITYKSIESIADTIINGKKCEKMVEIGRFYSDTVNTIYHYMFSENDSVFFYADNEFHLLYDFGATEGDTIVLDYFLTYNGSPLLMIIDSTGTIDINGNETIIQYITCGDGIMVEFGSHVIKDIGSTYFMFPTYDGTNNGPLRCYQDDSIGLFLSPYHPNYGWDHQNCAQIITDIKEVNKSDILIYPNPASDYVFLRNIDGPVNYRIISLVGRQFKQGVLAKSGKIRLNGLPNGTYIIEINRYNNYPTKSKLFFKIIVLN
jgi:hypothetical protein